MKVKRNATRRRPRCLRAIVLLAALLGQGVAGAESDAASFYIETITVDTPRLSQEIVLAESLLHEGEEYSEDELREAVHRINRLPFVLLAEFSLNKGSERGRYELVVKVFETRRWFFQVGANWQLNEGISELDRLDPRVDTEIGTRIGDTTDDLRSLVGRRFALGARSLLFASFGSEDGLFALGYQRYNLWNRNILLNLSLASEDGISSVSSSTKTVTARAQLGIPIRGNHALRVLAGWSRDDRTFSFGSDLDTQESEAEVAWLFNSLDDPVLPREGSLYEAGITWSDRDGVDYEFRDGLFEGVKFSERRLGLIVAAGRHWPVAERQSVSVNARGFFGEGLDSARVWEAEASLGHQVFLLRRLELDKWRELRFETQVSVLGQDSEERRLLGFSRGPIEDSWRIRTGLVYRNGWGLFRLFVEYEDRELR